MYKYWVFNIDSCEDLLNQALTAKDEILPNIRKSKERLSSIAAAVQCMIREKPMQDKALFKVPSAGVASAAMVGGCAAMTGMMCFFMVQLR